MKADVYQRITDQIVSELEKGVSLGSSLGMPSMPPDVSRALCVAMAFPIEVSTS